ncbi:MAG: hypothetical protein JSS91_05560 [Bacteroidetes bacterium]|nr:hypothetical protein [Bacteroidota bacterium]
MKQSNSYRKQRTEKADQLFEEFRKDNSDNSFPEVEKWLRNLESDKLNFKDKKSERKFFNMRSPKFKLAYAFLILAFIVAACNYPVTQQEPVADVIKWTVNVNDKATAESISNLEWTKKAMLSIKTADAGNEIAEYSLVLMKEDLGNTQKYLDQLKSISGIITIDLVPLNEKVTRPVYSLALNEIFKVDINASNMSDDELKNEIITQLEKNGMQGVQVSFEKNAEGRRISKIFIPENGIRSNIGFDLTIKDGDIVNRIKEIRKDGKSEPDRFKDKTDDEIRNMLMEELGDKNINPEDIKITRKDGKVMVNIKKKGIETNDEFEFKGDVK